MFLLTEYFLPGFERFLLLCMASKFYSGRILLSCYTVYVVVVQMPDFSAKYLTKNVFLFPDKQVQKDFLLTKRCPHNKIYHVTPYKYSSGLKFPYKNA